MNGVADVKTRLFFDKTKVDSVDELLPLYKAEEFESPFRSTVPLLDFVKQGQMKVILNQCGISAGAHLHFEYTVPPPRGQGRSSHTDVMILQGKASLAVEAKWTEAPSDSVATWLREVSTDNGPKVLSGWLSLLQPYAAQELRIAEFEDLPYQMIHRAASACAAGAQPQLLYLKFHSSDESFTAGVDWWQDQLAMFHQRLGSPAGLRFRLAAVELRHRDTFTAVKPLPKAVASTATALKAALRASPLFNFAARPILTIGELKPCNY